MKNSIGLAEPTLSDEIIRMVMWVHPVLQTAQAKSALFAKLGLETYKRRMCLATF
jgi:hypothetical protein